MKIEKINDNKLKVILSKEDLENNNISAQALREQNLESNEFFLDILYEVEEEFNMSLSGFPLLIEGTANSLGEFVFIITKLKKETSQTTITPKPFIKGKEKNKNLDSKYLIYCFNIFDDFVDFVNNIESVPKTFHNMLYQYGNMYYLIIKNTKTSKPLISQISIIISDYANIIPYPTVFNNKLVEYGSICIKDNAINTIKKYKA